MAKTQQYIPVYTEHIKAAAQLIDSGIITAADLGAAMIALTEYAETGSAPAEMTAGVTIIFTFMAPKVDAAAEAYAAKVEAGRAAATRQHAQKDDPEENEEQESANKGTQGYPKVPKDNQAIEINKNNNNKNKKEKTNKKEKAGGLPTERNGPKRNEALNYAMRFNDDLNNVLMEL